MARDPALTQHERELRQELAERKAEVERLTARVKELEADPRMALTFADLTFAEDHALIDGKHHMDDNTWARANRFVGARQAAYRAALAGEGDE